MSTRCLYYVNGSIPNWRVLIALHEKGLSFVPKRLHVMREPRETRSAEFLAINPRGRTPTLVDEDGVVVTESLAILQYLELRYPDVPLLPPVGEPGLLARTLAWVQESEALANAYEPLEMLFVHQPTALSADRRADLAGALAAVEEELSIWEGRLAEGPFLVGQRFSLADCALYPVLGYLVRRGLRLDAHPRLAAYQRRVRTREAAIAAHPEGWAHDVVRPDLFAQARSAVA